jgi:hypothetical protein
MAQLAGDPQERATEVMLADAAVTWVCSSVWRARRPMRRRAHLHRRFGAIRRELVGKARAFPGVEVSPELAATLPAAEGSPAAPRSRVAEPGLQRPRIAGRTGGQGSRRRHGRRIHGAAVGGRRRTAAIPVRAGSTLSESRDSQTGPVRPRSPTPGGTIAGPAVGRGSACDGRGAGKSVRPDTSVVAWGGRHLIAQQGRRGRRVW